jgi:membrane protein YqaA with SNARE-associated domain
MESLAKVLEFVGKYSWAVLVMVAFVLFVPNDVAKQLGIEEVRTTYKGFWWLALVLTGAVWLGAIFAYFDKRILGGWLERRRDERKRMADRQRRNENIRLRLDALDERERLWIKYCLFHNVQSLTARMDDPTAQSLVNKQILSQGSGSMLNLPFHLTDDVWRILIKEKFIFLSEQESDDPRFSRVLEEFRRSMFPRW